MLTAYDMLYLTGLLIASPYALFRLAADKRMRSWAAGRMKSPALPPVRKGSRPIWVHCASVGELNAARTFIDSLDARFPDRGWVISTFTDTGFEQARRRYGADRVFYCPLDMSPLVAKTLDRINPCCLALVELELWPNLLHLAHRRGIPVLLVNGRIREETARSLNIFRPLAGSLLRITPDICCVQNDLYSRRLRALGMPARNVRVTGNMKYDSVCIHVARPEQDKLRNAFGLRPDEPLLVAGSIWPGEERTLLACFSRLSEDIPELRLLIAPRHIERADEIESAVKEAGYACLRRSASGNCGTFDAPDERKPVLMLDTVGELVTAYSLASAAFVGRSLAPGGGQNMLEPAALGVPSVFGPYTENFSAEAELLLKAGAAAQVKDENELFSALVGLLADPLRRREAGEAGRRAVSMQQGATLRNIQALAELIE